MVGAPLCPYGKGVLPCLSKSLEKDTRTIRVEASPNAARNAGMPTGDRPMSRGSEV
jgi:hypothetical protein